MYFATFLFWLTGLTVVIVSILTKPQEDYRVIRTTFWTYKDKNPRPDDKLEETLENQVPKNKSSVYFTNSQQPLAIIVKEKNKATEEDIIIKYPLWKKVFLNWICGLDENVKKSETNKNKGELLSSVEQTQYEKYILNVNLVIIILVAVSLFIYFSVPPKGLGSHLDD